MDSPLAADVVVVRRQAGPLSLTIIGQPAAFATVTVGSAYFWCLASLWVAALRGA